MPGPEAGQPEPKEFHPAIESNFHTEEGPDIGRTKNTEVTREMASDEFRLRAGIRGEGPRNVEERLVDSDQGHQKLRKEWLDQHKAGEAGAEELATEVDKSSNRIEADYHRLQQAQQDHDARLLREAKDREADQYRKDHPEDSAAA